MSNPGRPEDFDPSDNEALLRFLAQFGITPGSEGQIDFSELARHMQGLMSEFTNQMASFGSTDDSGMNWGFTRDVTRRLVAASGPDPEPTPAQRSAIADAGALAELWIGAEVAFDPIPLPATAWSRNDWVDKTLSTWQELVRPVSRQLSLAMRNLMNNATEMKAAEPILRMAIAGMFAAQVGQALFSMATSVVSSGDIGIPVTTPARVAMLPTNIEAFAEGLEADPGDVLLYLAIRETARQRLFASVSWLGPQMLALIEHYARGITIDAEALEEAIESQLGSALTQGDLEQAGSALAGSLFSGQVSDEQRQVLHRLETLLALVEGWVDHVVAQVTSQRMPAASALTETLRRRRAAGGPAEAALKALVGLELRPRRTRDAENLWAATKAARGAAARDASWSHPDLSPGAEDLDDPLDFAATGRTASAPDDMDAELARLLEEEGGLEPPPGGAD